MSDHEETLRGQADAAHAGAADAGSSDSLRKLSRHGEFGELQQFVDRMALKSR